MNNNFNFEKLLSGWGQSQRQFPDNNELLKTRTLQALKINQPSPNTPRFSFKWPVFGLAGLAALALIIIIAPNISRPVVTNEKSAFFSRSNSNLVKLEDKQNASTAPTNDSLSLNAASKESFNRPMADSAIGYAAPAPNPQPIYVTEPSPAVPIADNRQFLKTSYSAQIDTRHVLEMSQTVQNIIKGSDGRIDSLSLDSNLASINFVIPAKNLDSLRTQIKNIVGARFYAESLRAQNKLPEKQDIEQQAKSARESIKSLEDQRRQITNTHNIALSSLQSQLYNNKKSLAGVEADLKLNPYNSQLLDKKKNLEDELSGLKNNLARENGEFNANLNSVDVQINSTQQQIDGLKTRDQNLVADVDTVNGYINFNQINFWEWLTAYVPAFWFALMFIMFSGALIYYLYRKSEEIKI